MTESSPSPVIVGGQRRPHGGEDRRARGAVLAILGFAFLLVGLVDLVLLWFPAHFDSLSWEFATVGRTLDGLPLSALGLGLLAYGGTRNHGSGARRFRTLSAGFALATVLVVGLGILFATALPAVLEQTGAEVLEGVHRAAVRHGAQAIIYPICFALIASVLWKAGGWRIDEAQADEDFN